MIRIAISLIAMLLAACASPPAPRQETGASLRFDRESWQSLQSALSTVPEGLRAALTQEAQARLQREGPGVSPAGTPSHEARAALLELVTHTADPALLPDANFESLSEVVVGDNRAADAYGQALADYLLQTDFACQQPLYAVYMQRRYAAGRAVQPCHSAVPFAVISRYDGAQITWLDPRRVQSIHLLFAGQSGQMASRFGHVALRLVVCPQTHATGAACDANLFEHVVVGFLAHVDGWSIDTLKALGGDYRAYLFANRFMDVYQEYAIEEFREIYSIPLRLSDAERASMLRELADIHWRYAGKYNFFTRNCATLLQEALRKSWPAFVENAHLKTDYLRPDSLFEAIKASGLAESSKLDKLDAAERSGHFFSSTREFYARALAEVRAAMLKPAFTDLDSYLEITPAKRHQDQVDDVQFTAQLASNQHLREAQIMLEEYAVLRSMRVMLMAVARYFEQQGILVRSEAIRQKLDAEHGRIFDDCLLAPIKAHMSPLQRLKGIPGEVDRLPGPASVVRCESPQNQRLMLETIARIGDPDSEQWQELMGINRYLVDSVSNLNLLRQM